MPCDSVQLNRIDLPKMAPTMVEAALRAAGLKDLHRQGANVWTFTVDGNRYTLRDGELTSYNASDAELSKVRNMIARGYSEQVVKLAAAKNNWTLKKTAERRFIATR